MYIMCLILFYYYKQTHGTVVPPINPARFVHLFGHETNVRSSVKLYNNNHLFCSVFISVQARIIEEESSSEREHSEGNPVVHSLE